MSEKQDNTLYQNLVDADVLTKGLPNIYQGKTETWRLRFQSWAARTTEMDYLKELINARLSYAAYTILSNNPLDSKVGVDPHFDEFAKGYAAGIRAIYVDIVKASSGNKTLQENKEDK